MGSERVNAFTDGVIAIIITIMVLELRVPEGASLGALRPELPIFGAYVLSFIYVGIYWNKHHPRFAVTGKPPLFFGFDVAGANVCFRPIPAVRREACQVEYRQRRT